MGHSLSRIHPHAIFSPERRKAFIGTSWFQWVDQPVTGRMDGENYNIGLVDVTDRPYTELLDAMKTTHQRLFDVHAGKIPPFDKLPQAQ
ncbi:MAG: hypothetical protein U5J83_05810 [Bryobacterales bacterium]|nr:hypothetical protein [Bryobacterales bacterium]